MWPSPAAKELGLSPERIVDKDGKTPEHPNQRLYDKHTGRLVQDGLTQFVGLWPTPTGGKVGNDLTLTCSGDGRSRPNKLGWAVAATPERMLPTPTVDDAGNVTRRSGDFQSLTRAVMFPTPRSEGFDAGAHQGKLDSLHSHVKLFPTPSVCGNHNRKGASATSGDGLATVVGRMLPTPAASDHKGSSQQGQRRGQLSEVVAGMKLNPDWVSRMMGYPDGWLDGALSVPPRISRRPHHICRFSDGEHYIDRGAYATANPLQRGFRLPRRMTRATLIRDGTAIP